MKKLIIPLIALTFGCSTPKSMELFESRTELESAIQYFDNGIVSDGPFKGLTLKKLPSYSYVNTNSTTVINLESQLRNNYPDWISLHELNKAQIIYETIREDFTYQQNPFNKLILEDIGAVPRKYRRKLREIQKNYWGFQDVDETTSLGTGNCISLTSLLNSHFKKSGINCEPIVLEAVTAHQILLISYDDGEIVIDPSNMSKYSFIENMKETKRVFDSEYVTNRYFSSKHSLEQ